MDKGDGDTIKVTVQNGDSAVASATFSIADILDAPQKAIAKLSDEKDDAGAKICVHAEEQQARQLQWVFCAKDLPNTDFGFNLKRRKKQMTDPLYELYGASGKKIYTSNLVEDSLDPVWNSVSFDVDVL